MARSKRKLKTRSRAHVKHTKALRKRRIRAAGSRRTAVSRTSRRARLLKSR
jgi:hypothetical protein